MFATRPPLLSRSTEKLSPGNGAIPWTSDFVDIEGDKRPTPHFQTRAKMTYDDNGMYFAVLMEEPHVWATITEHDAVIFHDNDFEDLPESYERHP